MKHYVYQYIDPRTDLPFYIGKGSGRRSQKHLWEARNGTCKNKLLQNIILKVGEPRIEIIQEFEAPQDAYDLERKLVQQFGRRINGTGILANIDEGGRGRTNYIVSDATRAKMAAAKLNKKLKRTPEHNAKISASHKERFAKMKELAE